ncbi:MAG: hypothetical protein KatS3mg114_1057 [Planctomycetaceae bacterium]|nr:MAG: hypothetical protein KatS3mg114_1057 [Planctomycetaceae bacterium]
MPGYEVYSFAPVRVLISGIVGCCLFAHGCQQTAAPGISTDLRDQRDTPSVTTVESRPNRAGPDLPAIGYSETTSSAGQGDKVSKHEHTPPVQQGSQPVSSSQTTTPQQTEPTERAIQQKISEVGMLEEESIPLNPQKTVLLDKAGKRLVLKGTICLRDGLLEMLVCLKRTKEHESIVAVDTPAWVVHAGLLALGAEPGQPVRYEPEYRPPTGQPVDIYIAWQDADGKWQRVRAQQWVRHATRRYWVQALDKLPPDLKLPDDESLRYSEKLKELLWYGPMSDQQRDELLKLSTDRAFQEAIRAIHRDSQIRELSATWVFAGSGFYVDPQTGEKFYQAEGGDLICVANFATATIDLAIASTADNADLMFEAYTERIPPLDTPVLVEIIPVFAEPPPTPSATDAAPSQRDATPSSRR